MNRHSELFAFGVVWAILASGAIGNLAGTDAKARISIESDRFPIAHAHNDYLHPRPLQDALEQRFGSFEADVFPVDNELLVAHSVLELNRTRTLEQLYLQPLRRLANSNGGRIYPGGGSVILLVDIKSQGAKAWEILDRQLKQYREIISETVDGRWIERAVTVIVSGDRPVELITGANPRLAGIDGRPRDLDRDAPVSLIPLISDDWGNHFRYRGLGPMPADEKKRLQELVQQAHASGRKLRFWATPESEVLWQELRDAQVDLIGTDDLPRLRKFIDQ